MTGYRSREERVNRLARYNSEAARGLLHSEEWREFMAREQAWFNSERNAEMEAQGGEEISPGVWLVPAPKKKRWLRFLT